MPVANGFTGFWTETGDFRGLGGETAQITQNQTSANFADDRDKLADDPYGRADDRDKIANDRDRVADGPYSGANGRDMFADDHDRFAGGRDQAANVRDGLAARW